MLIYNQNRGIYAMETKLNYTDMPSHDEQSENHSPLDPVKGILFGLIVGSHLRMRVLFCVGKDEPISWF